MYSKCSCYGLNWRHYFVFQLSILFISVGWSRHANIFCSFSTFREQSNWQQLYWIANNWNTADRNWTRERAEQWSKACALDHYHVECMGLFSPMQHYRPFSLIQLQKGRIVRNNEGEKGKSRISAINVWFIHAAKWNHFVLVAKYSDEDKKKNYTHAHCQAAATTTTTTTTWAAVIFQTIMFVVRIK